MIWGLLEEEHLTSGGRMEPIKNDFEIQFQDLLSFEEGSSLAPELGTWDSLVLACSFSSNSFIAKTSLEKVHNWNKLLLDKHQEVKTKEKVPQLILLTQVADRILKGGKIALINRELENRKVPETERKLALMNLQLTVDTIWIEGTSLNLESREPKSMIASLPSGISRTSSDISPRLLAKTYEKKAVHEQLQELKEIAAKQESLKYFKKFNFKEAREGWYIQLREEFEKISSPADIKAIGSMLDLLQANQLIQNGLHNPKIASKMIFLIGSLRPEVLYEILASYQPKSPQDMVELQSLHEIIVKPVHIANGSGEIVDLTEESRKWFEKSIGQFLNFLAQTANEMGRQLQKKIDDYNAQNFDYINFTPDDKTSLVKLFQDIQLANQNLSNFIILVKDLSQIEINSLQNTYKRYMRSFEWKGNLQIYPVTTQKLLSLEKDTQIAFNTLRRDIGELIEASKRAALLLASDPTNQENVKGCARSLNQMTQMQDKIHRLQALIGEYQVKQIKVIEDNIGSVKGIMDLIEKQAFADASNETEAFECLCSWGIFNELKSLIDSGLVVNCSEEEFEKWRKKSKEKSNGSSGSPESQFNRLLNVQAKLNLEKLGLKTADDLKRNYIFNYQLAQAFFKEPGNIQKLGAIPLVTDDKFGYFDLYSVEDYDQLGIFSKLKQDILRFNEMRKKPALLFAYAHKILAKFKFKEVNDVKNEGIHTLEQLRIFFAHPSTKAKLLGFEFNE